MIVLPLYRVEALRTSGIWPEIEWLKVWVYHIISFGHSCPVSTQVLTLVISIVHANNGFLLQKAILDRWANLELDRQFGRSWLRLLLLLLGGLLIHILRRWLLLLKLFLQFVDQRGLPRHACQALRASLHQLVLRLKACHTAVYVLWLNTLEIVRGCWGMLILQQVADMVQSCHPVFLKNCSIWHSNLSHNYCD